MDKIYECGEKFKAILSKKYRFVVATKKRNVREIILDFDLTDLRHMIGLQYVDDIVIERNPEKVLDAILNNGITDAILEKSKKYKERKGKKGGSVKDRIHEMRYLEEYLDTNNFIRIYEMQDFGSQIRADYFIESTLRNSRRTAYIFIRKRTENDNYVVVSFFKKYQVYTGASLYWMLKEKLDDEGCTELYRNENYKGASWQE